jgi:hypothetical protein
MASERIKLVPLLGCVLLLAACPGSDPKGEPDEPDAGEGLWDGGEEPESEPDPNDDPKADPEKPQQPSKPANGGKTPPKETPAEPSAPSKPAMNPSGGEQPAKPGDKPAPAGEPAAATSQRFFLPTPEPRNTQVPRIEIDSKRGVHAVYPAYAGGGAFYAYCPNDCVDPKAMKVVELPAEGVPDTAMLALTPDGRPRVLIPTYLRLYYAECDRNCTDGANWMTSVIVDHQSAQQVTGDALAVDSQGRPRFLMHTYEAYLGVGQKEPHTYYAQCDQNCSNPASWQVDSIQDQMWTYSTLRFDEQDRAHLAMVVISPASSVKQLAYARCDSSCNTADGWNGVLLAPALEISTAELKPSVSLALTSTGGVRMAGLTMPEPGARALTYFECDQACDQDNWSWGNLSEAYELGSGVDIAVDAKDRPRLVFTLNSNIGLYHCDESQCVSENANWELAKVEFASDLTPDTIILWPNCIADAWVLHDPTIALTADGSARVGYVATDISGGFNPKPDPTMTPCLAGKDMTLGRMALMPAL